MIETVQKRRRWPWAVLAAVLLLIAAPIAWRSRPLNAAETALVGRWVRAADGWSMEFRSDRIFFEGPPPGPDPPLEWSASEHTIRVTHTYSSEDSAREALADRFYLVMRGRKKYRDIQYRRAGSERLWFYGREFVRAPDKAAGP